jgi:putative ubiquitin-RnfH superfamily antitoxin RatB of RatAB toxin-antitoxin module
VRASGVLERWPELASGEPSIGLWGRAARAETPLRDGDRVELYRPIVADAKAMRRERARLSPSRRSRSAR